MGFTKLDAGLLQSSLMAEELPVFKVFISLLAACGPDGIARVSAVFLSAACYLPQEVVDAALARLGVPDPYSRSLDEEGRRVERVDGGFRIINYQRYRDWNYSMNPAAVRKRAYRQRRKVGHIGTCPGHSASASVNKGESAERGSEKPPAGFDAFWERYPRKAGKKDAVAAYRAALKDGASAEELDAALGGYIAEIGRLRTEETFIKYPATFLRSERWKDYAPKHKLTPEEWRAQQDAELEALRGQP